MPLIVTPSDQAGADARARAARLARALGGRFVARRDVDWSAPVVVVGRQRVFVRDGGRELGWHPGMLHTRREAGARHPFLRAVAPRAGGLAIDCTLGLGTDAVFLAEVGGMRVIGVEASPVLACMAAEGLGGRIAVVCTRATAFLAGLGDAAADVVIADPLFPVVPQPSAGLDVVRRLGVREGIDGGWLAEARRVARRVVVKDAVGGALLEALGAPDVIAGRRTRYGIWCAP